MKDQVIIITGAAMGLGLATAELLAKEGAKLVLVDYNEDALKDAEQKLKEINAEVALLSVKADVSSEEQVKNYVDKAVEKFGRIDGLYNNAGIEGKQASIVDYDLDIFKKVLLML